jgi:hypothetical protein
MNAREPFRGFGKSPLCAAPAAVPYPVKRLQISWSWVLIGTKRIAGRMTASAQASPSIKPSLFGPKPEH